MYIWFHSIQLAQFWWYKETSHRRNLRANSLYSISVYKASMHIAHFVQSKLLIFVWIHNYEFIGNMLVRLLIIFFLIFAIVDGMAHKIIRKSEMGGELGRLAFSHYSPKGQKDFFLVSNSPFMVSFYFLKFICRWTLAA